MSDKNYSEKILDYLHGRLKGKEKMAFEQALQKNSKLRKELETVRASKEALDYLAFKKMKAFLKAEKKKKNAEKKNGHK